MSRSPTNQTMSSWEGEGTLHCYMLDYLQKRNFGKAAAAFAEETGLSIDSAVPIDAPQGLLFEWWSVFWDVFLAHTGKTTNRYASVYVQSLNAAKALQMGGRPQMPPGALPQMPPMGPNAVGFGSAQPARSMAVNGHPNLPNPAATPTMPNQRIPPAQAQVQAAQAQAQAQYQRQMAATAHQQALSRLGQQPQMPVHSLSMPAHVNIGRPDAPIPLQRDFLVECMQSCGLGNRDLSTLTTDEQEHLQNFLRSPQGQQMISLSNQRMMQQQAVQQAAMYANSYATPNGAYFPHAAPSPAAAQTPLNYHASPPPSAPPMQSHFSQPVPATSATARRSATTRPTPQNPQHHASAPPTPEMTSTALGGTSSSPRSRKRPRTDVGVNGPGQPQQSGQPQQQQVVQSPHINGIDPYPSNVPMRPGSAASMAQQANHTPSPRLPQTYSAAHMNPAPLAEADEAGRSQQQHGQMGGKAPERKRSPMAPPPIPPSSQPAVASTPSAAPQDDQASGTNAAAQSPAQAANGLVGTASSNQSSQNYYPQSQDHAAVHDLAYDPHGASAAGMNFNFDELTNLDFDINSFINI